MNTVLQKILTAISLLSAASAFGGSITLFDDTFTLKLDGATVSSGSYEVKWGTYSAGVFTPYLGQSFNSDNSGYADVASPEFSVSFTASGNTAALVESQASVAILFVPDDAAYSSSVPQVVLTDASWIIPTFTLTGPDLSFEFTSSTTVQSIAPFVSTYSSIGGLETISVSAVPEPSTFAAIAGLAVLGAVATRRRRSA